MEIFQILASQGVAGLWQMLVEKLGDIKEMILEQVKNFVMTKIITAGITWLIGLLNPAAAFIKACKLIYDVVMFFVNNGSRIPKFVNTVIDSIADIVKGNISASSTRSTTSSGRWCRSSSASWPASSASAASARRSARSSRRCRSPSTRPSTSSSRPG